jgi:hypothetical protein
MQRDGNLNSGDIKHDNWLVIIPLIVIIYYIWLYDGIVTYYNIFIWTIYIYLVGGWPTPLKNDGVRQLGLFSIYGKLKNVTNHQPDKYWIAVELCPTSIPTGRTTSIELSGLNSHFWVSPDVETALNHIVGELYPVFSPRKRDTCTTI